LPFACPSLLKVYAILGKMQIENKIYSTINAKYGVSQKIDLYTDTKLFGFSADCIPQ